MKSAIVVGCIVTAIGSALVSDVLAKERIKTDVDAVYSGGTQNRDPSLKVLMQPGLYEIGEVDGHSDQEYLLVDTYTNDEDKILAVQFSIDALDSEHETIGRFYQGRLIKQGTVMMLSPLGIDGSGNLRDSSEMRTDAAVVEVSLRPGSYRYPYVLKGRNGALDGRLLGMRASTSKRPVLKANPSNGIFAEESKNRVKMSVNGNEVAIYSGSLADQNFNMVPLNGMQGKFAALTKSTLDTMMGDELGDEEIKRIATFIGGCFGSERMMIARPAAEWGAFRLQFFKKARPSFLEWLFGRGNVGHGEDSESNVSDAEGSAYIVTP